MQTASDYSDQILDFFEDRSRRGRCENPTHRAYLKSDGCGDSVLVEIHTTPAGVIEKIRFMADGCCLSQAGAAAMAEQFEGKTISELLAIKSVDVMGLAGIEISEARRECWKLAFRVARCAADFPLAQPAEAVA